MKRAVVGLLVCALLAGCATKPNGDLDDSECVPDPPHGVTGGNPLVDIAAILIIDLTWFAGCEAVVGISNGIRHFHPAQARDGVYYSPDGAFSVGVPMAVSDEYQAQQQRSGSKDTVVFVPRTPGEPAYGVTVLTKLDATQAALSLPDFASQASADLLGTGVTQVQAQDVQLGANAARLVVYRAPVPVAGTAPPHYYLMYFVKTAHTAAVLSVTWPYECPRCAAGSDISLRNMDPVLDAFLDSFELSSTTR
ncbi:MAG TPA: hypothetical protein VGM16_04355 [Gammaproteobacteria bacterium]